MRNKKKLNYKRLNKKGYFFSLTVLLLVILLYVFFSAQQDSGFTKKSQVTEQRLQELNKMLYQIEKDSETSLRIATTRSILDLNEYVQKNKVGINPNDFNATVQELILNGSILGANMLYSGEHSVKVWQENITTLLKSLGAQAEFLDNEVLLTQNDPWTITAQYISNINIKDEFTDSSWNHTINTSINIDITKFYDPLFLINASYPRKITKKPDSIIDLENIIQSGYYVQSNYAPSFLQRFQDYPPNINNNKLGIESLIDRTSQLIPQSYEELSIIDHLYFKESIIANKCKIEGHIIGSPYNESYSGECK